MKKFKFAFTTAALCAVLFFSCSNDDASKPPEDNSSSSNGYSSSSVEQQSNVFCQVNGACVEVPAEMCSAAGGTLMFICETASSSSEGFSGSSSSGEIGSSSSGDVFSSSSNAWSSSSSSSGVSSSSGSNSSSSTITNGASSSSVGISNSLSSSRAISFWSTYIDKTDGGTSAIDHSTITNAIASVDYILGNRLKTSDGYYFDAYVGISLGIKNNAEYQNILTCERGIIYSYQGANHDIAALLSTVTDHNNHKKNIPASASWTTATVLFSSLKQDTDWGKQVAFNKANIEGLRWQVNGSNASGSLSVKNVQCLNNTTELCIFPSLRVCIEMQNDCYLHGEKAGDIILGPGETLVDYCTTFNYIFLTDENDPRANVYCAIPNQFWPLYSSKGTINSSSVHSVSGYGIGNPCDLGTADVGFTRGTFRSWTYCSQNGYSIMSQ